MSCGGLGFNGEMWQKLRCMHRGSTWDVLIDNSTTSGNLKAYLAGAAFSWQPTLKSPLELMSSIDLQMHTIEVEYIEIRLQLLWNSSGRSWIPSGRRLTLLAQFFRDNRLWNHRLSCCCWQIARCIRWKWNIPRLIYSFDANSSKVDPYVIENAHLVGHTSKRQIALW